MNKEEYSKYLNHPTWREKREEVLKYYGNRCACCSAIERLEIHHKTYVTGNKPWEYRIDNFEVLCTECHAKAHDIEYKPERCKKCGVENERKYVYCFQGYIRFFPQVHKVTSSNR